MDSGFLHHHIFATYWVFWSRVTPEFLHLLLNFWPSVASLALNRGICCSSGCTHTPPQPSHTFDFSTAVEHILSIQLWHHSRGGRGILFSLPSLTLPLHNHVLTLSLPHILTGRVIWVNVGRCWQRRMGRMVARSVSSDLLREIRWSLLCVPPLRRLVCGQRVNIIQGN